MMMRMQIMNDRKRLEKLVMVSIWCIQEDSALRPTMRKVTQMLEGIVEVSMSPRAFGISFCSSRIIAFLSFVRKYILTPNMSSNKEEYNIY